MKNALVLALLLFVSATSSAETPSAIWDVRGTQTKAWTQATVRAINTYGPELTSTVPADIHDYCANYPKLDKRQRTAFWVTLLSTIALQESYFRPQTAFKEGFTDSAGQQQISRGLLQLSIDDHRNYGCVEFMSAEDLHDPAKNIVCGVRIMNKLVGRDKVIATSEKGRHRGLARYWGTLRKEGNIVLIAMATSSLPFCR